MQATTLQKTTRKQNREFKVLIGLIDHYLKTGKPVGSNTLKEAGFGVLSSATIRNYFANLEQQGFLIQHHSSGGRIPTHQALKIYAQEYADHPNPISPSIKHQLKVLRNTETREITAYLQKAAETLSDLAKAAVFISAPRFDQDYIVNVRLVPIDARRCLCIIVTDFGMIKTEVIQLEDKLSSFAAKRIEAYFHWRLTGNSPTEHFEEHEELLAQKIYNELLVRYIVGYSNFIDAELYRTGFSKLLGYSEFRDPAVLASTLGLFENSHSVRLLVKECCTQNRLRFWIGDDLEVFSRETPDCAVLTAPYHINQGIAGAVGILGPSRVPYRDLFALMNELTSSISDALTRNIFKFKITYRQPKSGIYSLLPASRPFLIE